ncbi:cyclin-D1-binding protein 1 homolog isoform X1 [Takifugu rubripes]|uniref:cyclin-D1-binding protein 1 homolog isoform X1 n=1 Tax=Takifugu rubripes TaxID=31033 RepID=UPI0011452232|nr:cyclin-D1-binding protein 1 isoform X1 [Takifugu rubripes]
MSSDVCVGSVCVPLRNLQNSIQSVRDRVKDGEAGEAQEGFDLSTFWDALNQAAKVVSQEATKLSLAFSKPPVPSQQEGEKLVESVLESVLTLAAVYHWLPKSHGVSLRRQVRGATVEVLDGLVQLLEALLSSPLQRLSQDQLTSTGGVWQVCDHFAQLPKDNKAAVILVLSAQMGVVKDAIEEMEQALADSEDPFSDILDPVGEEPRGNRDTYWSEEDRRVIGPCQGLMKASAASLRKLTAAVKTNADVSTSQNLDQLDDLADISKEISPGVDDLALCLYPPLDHSGVDACASRLAAQLKKVLEVVRSSHVCGEPQLSWVQFLEGAVEHNLQKIKELLQQDS